MQRLSPCAPGPAMPRTRRRLDLLWVPVQVEQAVDRPAFDDLAARWRALGWLDRGPGSPAGGFARLWLDDPGRVALYANQLGGFQVRCPESGGPVVAGFNAAMKSWRAGGPRTMDCPVCPATHRLEQLDFRPAAAFASGAVVLSDAARTTLRPSVLEELAAITGAGRVVLRRPS